MSEQAPAKPAIDPERWGKAILEEILFRAAKSASEAPPGAEEIQVAMTFSLRPRLAEHAIEISTPGAVEAAISTLVPLQP